MVQTRQITFYDHYYTPFAHRVHIALKEAKAEYIHYTVDITNKPAWYAAKVNPLGKIPALTYGGPHAPPEDPSPEAAKLNESLVIVEFIADLFPESKLLPADPIQRAHARIFISMVEDRIIAGWAAFFCGSEGSRVLLDGIEALQIRLPKTGFAVGEWSIADVAAAPFLVRTIMMLENEIGKYPVGEGKKTLEALGQPKFARIMKYIQDVQARPSFKLTWDEAQVLAICKINPAMQRY